MSVITRILDSIDNLLYSQEIRRREAYLAQAQNAQDLEARMRKVDSDYWRPILWRLTMISALRRFMDTRRPRISVRARVNLVSMSGVIERTDGVVEAVVGEEAYVDWANGAHSVESTRHLVQIGNWVPDGVKL